MLNGEPTTARDAAVLFMRGGAQAGWGRRELAAWLVCHYGSCVAESSDPPRSQAPARRATAVTPDALGEVVADARMRMITLLEDLRDRDTAESVTRSIIARGFVEAVRDEHGAIAHVPVDQRRMRLADRVASLFVADYLNAPFDYWRGRVATECFPRRDSGVTEIAAQLEIVEEEPAPVTLRLVSA